MGDGEDEPPQGVIVAVRVRPLWVDGREKGCSSVVRMEGKQTILHPDPEDPEAEPRKYAFDYSYWSADGYVADADGVLLPDGEDSHYASQETVWADIGSVVMKNALRGFNCTVFAYGQSGAGKSFSVVGYGPNIGIIPRAVKEIFSIVESNEDAAARFEVEIAMIEIYMDKVYDLLTPRKSKREELKVFINRGEVFIYNPKDRSNRDIIYRACKDADQAEAFRKQGDENRTVRPTGMNPSSSRAHTVFIVRLKKFSQNGDSWVEDWRSKINLVDLAGSERPSDTGLSGIGLQEGVAINESLSALGRVMVQLVEGKRVNYRANKLTEVLAESLNGRAVTCMIAALSPADLNYGDTLSTLRFADNAKKMPVKVEQKLSPTQQLIAELRAENEALKKRMGLADGEGIVEDEEAKQKAEEAQAHAAELQSELETMRSELEDARSALETEEADDAEFQQKIQALQAKAAEANSALQAAEEAESQAAMDAEQLRERQEAIEILLREQEADFNSKLAASEELQAAMATALEDSGLTAKEVLEVFERTGVFADAPYLINPLADINDHLLVPLHHAELAVGSGEGTSPCLRLSGESIAEQHARFRTSDGEVLLEPLSEKAATFVNGEPVGEPRKLVHGDRIVFGAEQAFRFVDPSAEPAALAEAALLDWDGRALRQLEQRLGVCQQQLAQLKQEGVAIPEVVELYPLQGEQKPPGAVQVAQLSGQAAAHAPGAVLALNSSAVGAAQVGGSATQAAAQAPGLPQGPHGHLGSGGAQMVLAAAAAHGAPGAAAKLDGKPGGPQVCKPDLPLGAGPAAEESALEMAQRIMQGGVVDKEAREELAGLREVVAHKMEGTSEFVMLNTINESLHRKDLDSLAGRLAQAEAELAAERQRRLEAQQALAGEQLKAGQAAQNAKLELQTLQAKLDQLAHDLAEEKKKCCNCCKCCCAVS